jgi:putative glutamine amidotransferase
MSSKRPVIGVPADRRLIGLHPFHAVGEKYLLAISEAAGALPLLIPGLPEAVDIADLVATLDGIVLTGARANVHPTRFGVEAHTSYEPYDEPRDALALDLIKTCVERSVPLLGICRGFQEMGVAFGSTLHPEIRELPGRINHRMPRLPNGEIHPDQAVVFGDRHNVHLTAGGVFAGIFGSDCIRVNSLHGQGILEPGGRIIVEGLADDGTIEAIRVAEAPGFALGVQWHAEYDPQTNPINRALFEAFGAAIKERHAGKA